MTSITYDTHAGVKRLMANGYSDIQAEAFVREVAAAQTASSGQSATKEDLLALETRLQQWMFKWMFSGFVGIMGMFVAIMLRLS